MPPSPEATTPTNQSDESIPSRGRRLGAGLSDPVDDLVRGATLPRKDNDVVVAGCNPADVQEPYSLCFSCELPSTPLQKGSKGGTLPQQLSRLLLLLLGRFIHVCHAEDTCTYRLCACVRRLGYACKWEDIPPSFTLSKDRGGCVFAGAAAEGDGWSEKSREGKLKLVVSSSSPYVGRVVLASAQ